MNRVGFSGVYCIPSLDAKAIATDYNDSAGIGKALRKTKNWHPKNTVNRKIVDLASEDGVGLMKYSTKRSFFEETAKLSL